MDNTYSRTTYAAMMIPFFALHYNFADIFIPVNNSNKNHLVDACLQYVTLVDRVGNGWVRYRRALTQPWFLSVDS